MSLAKVLFVDQKSAPVSDGEQFCEIIDLAGYREKHASELSSFMRDFKPQKAHVYLHTIALGAGEYYGANRNGDYFKEKDLIARHSTFVTHANVYSLHKNKPKEGHKKYGNIVHSWYNHRMHRVELVIELPETDNPDVIRALRQGKPIGFSMGCKVPFDVCSICGNEAPEEEDYCAHIMPKLGTPEFLKYGLNRILPDGRLICVYNPNPLFFDYSKVFRPADRTAYNLSKVAYAKQGATPAVTVLNKYADYKEKSAYLNKMSKLVKRFSGVGLGGKEADMTDIEVNNLKKFVDHAYPAIAEKLPPISDKVVGDLAPFPMRQIISTFIDNDIFLTTPEFMRILFKKETGKDMPLATLRSFMQMQGDTLSYFSKHPDELDKVTESGIYDVSKSNVNKEISKLIEPIKNIRVTIQILRPAREKEASLPTYMERNLGFLPKAPDSYSVTLPSGQRYEASSTTADTIHDEERTADTIKRLGRTALPLLGGAGLLGLAWRKAGRGSLPWVKNLTRAGVTIPVVGSSALIAKHQWDKPSSTPYVKTDQGAVIPARAFRPSYENKLL